MLKITWDYFELEASDGEFQCESCGAKFVSPQTVIGLVAEGETRPYNLKCFGCRGNLKETRSGPNG